MYDEASFAACDKRLNCSVLQGAMQGALAGARALASGVGPLIFAGLFALFTQSWSPFPYFPGGSSHFLLSIDCHTQLMYHEAPLQGLLQLASFIQSHGTKFALVEAVSLGCSPSVASI